MFIHWRRQNYILNLFLHIYYHDFILADNCIALKVIYFGGIYQKCTLTWWISFQCRSSEIPQPSSKFIFCSHQRKHKWTENIELSIRLFHRNSTLCSLLGKRKDFYFSILAALSKRTSRTINNIAYWIWFYVFFTVMSSLLKIDLLPRFNILVASTKIVRSIHWLLFQNHTHQLLHLSRKFSLLLLCTIGSEACLAELKDGSLHFAHTRENINESRISNYPSASFRGTGLFAAS